MMGTFANLLLAMWLCVLSGDTTIAQSAGEGEAEAPAVRMVLTAFSVNGESLELSYKIVNGTDHDVWVCEGLQWRRGWGTAHPVDQEVFLHMLDDARTLVVRKRVEVPLEYWPELMRHEARYVRVCAGQERIWSLSFAVPVEPNEFLASSWRGATDATRLVLEIGFYDEDLWGKIRRILEIADRLNCTDISRELEIGYWGLYDRYFGGLEVSREFGGLSGFDDTWPEGSEEITIPRLWPSVPLGESSLTIVVDGVSIPYTRD